MPETTTTDIAALAKEALEEATNPEKIKTLVFQQINKTVEAAVIDAVRSYSPFGRDLEKKIEQALSLNKLDLPNYNNIICAMVQDLVSANVSSLIDAQLKTDIAQMLKIAPKETTLSDIVDEMTRRRKDNDEYGEVTCHVEYNEPYRALWGPEWTIYLDEDNDLTWSNRQQAEIKLEIWHGLKADSKINSEDLNTGTIRGIYQNGSAIADSSHGFTRSSVYGLTGRLLALYAGASVITVNEDEVCTTIGDN